MEDVPTYDKLVADNITAARARRRLSQKELAARMGALGFEWRQQIVAVVETGRRRVTVAEILGLAFALETSIGVLLEPVDDVSRIALPSGRNIDAGSAAWSVRHFNDGTIEWKGDVPEFTEIPESRRSKEALDAAIGPMARYGRYVADRESILRASVGPEHFISRGPTPAELDINPREWRNDDASDHERTREGDV